MKLFGRGLAQGTMSFTEKSARIECSVEKIERGYKVKGYAKGKLGRIKVFRTSAPKEFLMNNYQSWGPLQKVPADTKFEGIEEVMKKNSPYVFTPVPETFLKSLV